MSHDSPPAPGGAGSRRPRLIIGLVAIAAVAILVAALSVAFFTRSSQSESAVPDTAALAGPLADQELQWEECEFGEGLAAPLPQADLSNVECATMTVPRDWNDPDPDETWDVRVSMAHNIDSSAPDYHTTVITHPGGPYTSGLSFSSTVQFQTPELRPTTNYVSFDQRGLGQSSRAECEYEHPADATLAEQIQAAGEACSQDPEVATITTEQTAYDMDFIRHLLGLETVTYMGYSYGSWLGTWYGSLFHENIERMVLDSAVDSTQETIQVLYESAHEGRDRQFRLHMMNFIARNDATYGLGTDPEVIWQRYFDATESPEMAQAAYWGWLSTGANNAFATAFLYPDAAELVRLLISEGEAVDGAADPAETVTRIIDGMAGFDDTRRAGAHAALEQFVALDAIPAPEGSEMVQATYGEVIEFTRCTDGEWTQGLEYWEEFNERTAAEAPLSAQLQLLSYPPTCAFWPTDSAMPVASDDFPETIVLQAELDSMTPFEQGRESGLGLPNTTLIAIDNENAHGVFPYGTEIVDRAVLDFLLGGERPEGTIVAPGKPILTEVSTFESWLPIDEEGQHDGEVPLFTDPTIPAETAELSAPAEQ